MIFREEMLSKLTTYFKRTLGVRDYKRGWLKGDCPHCGKIDKFGVNLHKNKTNCFSCGEGTRPLDLILKLEKFETKKELWDFLKGINALERVEQQYKPVEYSQVNLPESFRLITLGDSQYARLAREYLKGRGFNPFELSLKGVGYCTAGEYAGCIIFPCFAQGNLVYFMGRRFINRGEKFKNPPLDAFGIGKAQIIYNEDALYIYNRIQIVESYTNAITIGDTAIATLGKIISNYQLSTIIRSSARELDLILDPDAYLDSLQLALKLVPHKTIRIIKMEGDQDVNDIGRKAIKKLIKVAKPMSYMDIHKAMVFQQDLNYYEQSHA